ncbi:hypothetical protein [Bacillus solimangrovi]|uniref:Uncharacterized protein n=1 Tax=Bacillus solimangrovi TaxID=1305675 RepID=A0A1E5LD55_9BACI|nr:hypothetical protein [Bacillus solimangrovi]OEH92003.1 hypothetical protein BFG57_17210 [Bacillus solimangrovi]
MFGFEAISLLIKGKSLIYLLNPRFQPLWQLEQEKLGDSAVTYRGQQGIVMLIVSGLFLYLMLSSLREIPIIFLRDALFLLFENELVTIFIVLLIFVNFNIAQLLDFKVLEQKNGDAKQQFKKARMMKVLMIIPLVLVLQVLIVFYV